MKKIFATLALAALSLGAAAQTTVVLENTYHSVRNTPDASMYFAAGLAQSTKFGTVDAYWQGVRAWGTGYTDRLNGFEVGYSYAFPVGSATVIPRVAYGTMGNIPNTEVLKYMLYSVEAGFPLKPEFSGYVSVSHQNGLNKESISASNRVQAGLDLLMSKNVTLRIGGSVTKELGSTQRGVVSMMFYTF